MCAPPKLITLLCYCYLSSLQWRFRVSLLLTKTRFAGGGEFSFCWAGNIWIFMSKGYLTDSRMPFGSPRCSDGRIIHQYSNENRAFIAPNPCSNYNLIADYNNAMCSPWPGFQIKTTLWNVKAFTGQSGGTFVMNIHEVFPAALRKVNSLTG